MYCLGLFGSEVVFVVFCVLFGVGDLGFGEFLV